MKYRVVTNGKGEWRVEEGRRVLFWTFWRQPDAWVYREARDAIDMRDMLRERVLNRKGPWQEADEDDAVVTAAMAAPRSLSQHELADVPIHVRLSPGVEAGLRQVIFANERAKLKAAFINKYYHTAYAAIQGPPALAEQEFLRDMNALLGDA